ncbi:MAG: 3-keto-disaccharide hydrolase [Planctomycetota bacterium]|jgi:hypothetical protein
MDNKPHIIKDILFNHTYFIRPISRPKLCCTILLLLTVSLGACRRKTASTSIPSEESDTTQKQAQTEAAASTEPEVSEELPKTEPNASEEIITTETSLFDGKSLGHWAITDFGGQGKVYVKDGAIYMEMGNDMTGINWKGPLIRMNYEIMLEAMRISGSDFFCGLTFPVAENPCSLILGGWGGGLCGLSNIDYYDAANNETTTFTSFEDNKWYKVRLRVTPDRIEAWLDDEEIVNIEITGRKIDIRAEVDLSQPLGIATWQTGGAVRNIRIRPLEN